MSSLNGASKVVRIVGLTSFEDAVGDVKELSHDSADDDDRRSCFLHDVPPVCRAAHAGCPNVTDTSYQNRDRVSFLGYDSASVGYFGRHILTGLGC